MRVPIPSLVAAIVFALAACADEPEPASSHVGIGLPDRPPRGLTSIEWGERLFTEQGCVGCHTLYGAQSVGPPLDGITGESRTFADGATGVVDEAYVRESIDAPDAMVVAGYSPVMPSYRHRLSQAQVDALVEFLASRH